MVLDLCFFISSRARSVSCCVRFTVGFYQSLVFSPALNKNCVSVSMEDFPMFKDAFHVMPSRTAASMIQLLLVNLE